MADEAKKQLRRRLQQQRAGFTAEQVATSSQRAAERILACDAYRKAQCIMGYLAFGRELSVDAVLTQALADGKQVAVPLVLSATAMTAVRLYNMQDFEYDRFGIRSVRPPVTPVAAQDIELVLVPGVAFDSSGGRLGMGAGYYDRFLPQAVHAVRLGVAYDSLLQEQLPCDEYDVRMQLLASESGILPLSGRFADK